MKLKLLKKPIAFFDLETTGTDIGKDRIVEIAIVKISPDGQMTTMPSTAGKENQGIGQSRHAHSTEASLGAWCL
jgi:DNA polymerase III epsilon subunit-like protein